MSDDAGTPIRSQRQRTPDNARSDLADGVCCFERDFEGSDLHPPVRLVVFDCDETLTVSTFLPPDEKAMQTQIGWNSIHAEYIVSTNFVPPWNLDRLAQLRDTLKELANTGCEAKAGAPSTKLVLAVLTRNNDGAVACLNLLMMAGLTDHLSVVWCMQKNVRLPSGAYKDSDGRWREFSPPLQDLPDHKADALAAIARDPTAWFPHGSSRLAGLKLEEIVLVDDARSNFQSFTQDGPQVVRCCKVAHYDAEYLDLGWIKDMGGIGAHDPQDFRRLLDFVKEPWNFRFSDNCADLRCAAGGRNSCAATPTMRPQLYQSKPQEEAMLSANDVKATAWTPFQKLANEDGDYLECCSWHALQASRDTVGERERSQPCLAGA